jgi:intergrase/recombinase
MDLAKRDLLINTLKTQKKEKEQFLLHNKTQLSERKHDNRHLSMVLDGYNDYFSLLQQERDKQKTALKGLIEYLTKIILDPTSTAEIIKEAKHDKNVILDELNNL